MWQRQESNPRPPELWPETVTTRSQDDARWISDAKPVLVPPVSCINTFSPDYWSVLPPILGLRGGEPRRGRCSTAVRLLTRHSRDDCHPPTPHSPDLAPAAVEVHSERSPIADDRRDRRRFATGPTRCPAKCVPALENTLEAVYRHWRGLLSRRQTPRPLVRRRTIPTDRSPRVGEIWCQVLRIEGCRVVNMAGPPQSLISIF
jgi:hypothetical protein